MAAGTNGRVVLAGFVLTVGASAQPAPKITVDVRNVLVPVVVTDSKGRHVTGLKRSDFEVFEDGVPQEIAGFSTTVDSSGPEIGLAGPKLSPLQGGQDPASNPVRRTYLICLDTLHSSFASFTRVRDALLKSLRQERGADSQYALMALGRELSVVKDSTRDAASIEAAIGSKEFTKVIQTTEATSTGVAIQEFTALMRNYCGMCACGSNAGTDQPGCSGVKGRVKAFLASYEERTYFLNHNFLVTLYDLVRATASIPAARTILFVSDGFNRFPGRELYAIVQGFSPRDHSFEFPSRDTEPELENILKLATRYDVKFYTLDSRGVYSPVFNAGGTFDASTPYSTTTQLDARNRPSESTTTTESLDLQGASVARENADAMAQLARDTGGLFFQNSNDLAKSITRALTDTREYYVLAYVSKNDALDGHYRKIKVEVKGGDKFRVNAKAGYWAAEK
ncbi:MAG: VWA domain-containing protein [Bryobacteraceae bacterium]